jgi:hypothetical protein
MYISLGTDKDRDLLHDSPILSTGRTPRRGSTPTRTDWLTNRSSVVKWLTLYGEMVASWDDVIQQSHYATLCINTLALERPFYDVKIYGPTPSILGKQYVLLKNKNDNVLTYMAAGDQIPLKYFTRHANIQHTKHAQFSGSQSA